MKKNEVFDLASYLSDGVENIVVGAIKASISNPKESIFLAKFALACKQAKKLRLEAEKNGEHIPPFLIASITSKCNLHCAGCYARSNHACHDKEVNDQLTDEEWLKIFHDAKSVGVAFILLAGGEPMMRPEVIRAAGKIQDILFPIFTNGTMINEEYINMFLKYRNLVPVLSIEGDENATDTRRGEGVYRKIFHAMDSLQQNKIFYGASVTVTKENLKEVTSVEFLDNLCKRECKLVFYVEYVPVASNSKESAPEAAEREYLNDELLKLRQSYEDLLLISFPGDEKASGGCLAAGRGFFHINSHGGAEPCPFSPYSDTSLKNTSLKEAMNSPLFRKLRDSNVLIEDHSGHVGGCVLFEREELVRTVAGSCIQA